MSKTGESIGVALSVMSRLERGMTPLDVATLVLLCAALGRPPVEVVQAAQDTVFPRGWPYMVEPP